MSLLLLSIFTLVVTIVGLIAGNAYYQAVLRLPRNTPANYLKKRLPEKCNCKVVVLLGDSITHGRIGVNYVDMIEEREKGKGFQIINAGINSELAWNNLQRIDDIIKCNPEIVTVLIGTNDANASMSEDNMKSYVRRMKLPRRPDRDWYRESLTSMVNRLKAETDARVALISIPPIGEDINHPAFLRSTEYSIIVREIAEKANVAYLPLHEKMVEYLQEKHGKATYPYEKYYIGIIRAIISQYIFRRGWDSIAKRSGFSLHVDYLHLNTQGARMVAELVSEFIQSL